jgi:hypothetical protein
MEEVYDTAALVSDDAKLKEEEEEKKIQKMKCDDDDDDDDACSLRNSCIEQPCRTGRAGKDSAKNSPTSRV